MSASTKKCKGEGSTHNLESPIQIQIQEIPGPSNLQPQDQQHCQPQSIHFVGQSQLVLQAQKGMELKTPAKGVGLQLQNQEVKEVGTASFWNRLSKNKKKAIIASHIFIVLIAIFGTMAAVQLFHLRDIFIKTKVDTFASNNQSRSIVVQNFNFSHFVWLGENENTQGQIITLPQPTQEKGSPAPGIIVVYDRQMGITLKMLGECNYIIEIDPNQLALYHSKHHPVQAKRLLAYLSLKRHLQDKNFSNVSSLTEQQVLQKVAEATKMNDAAIQQTQYYIANRTPAGLELQTSNTISSRLLQFGSERLLLLNDWLYLMYQNTNKIKKMAQAAQNIKEKEGITIIVQTNIKVINNKNNVTISLNSSTNVDIKQGKDSQVTVNTNTQIQIKGDSQPKRSLSTIQSKQRQDKLLKINQGELKPIMNCTIQQKQIACQDREDFSIFGKLVKHNLQTARIKTIIRIQKGGKQNISQNQQKKPQKNIQAQINKSQTKPNNIST